MDIAIYIATTVIAVALAIGVANAMTGCSSPFFVLLLSK
jgi:hypothetical protein